MALNASNCTAVLSLSSQSEISDLVVAFLSYFTVITSGMALTQCDLPAAIRKATERHNPGEHKLNIPLLVVLAVFGASLCILATIISANDYCASDALCYNIWSVALYLGDSVGSACAGWATLARLQALVVDNRLKTAAYLFGVIPLAYCSSDVIQIASLFYPLNPNMVSTVYNYANILLVVNMATMHIVMIRMINIGSMKHRLVPYAKRKRLVNCLLFVAIASYVSSNVFLFVRPDQVAIGSVWMNWAWIMDIYFFCVTNKFLTDVMKGRVSIDVVTPEITRQGTIHKSPSMRPSETGDTLHSQPYHGERRLSTDASKV